MSYYVWVGQREIDCKFDDLFSDSICYFSDKNITQTRKANIFGATFNCFIKDKMLEILDIHPEAKFIFYNPKIAYRLESTLQRHVECLNDATLLNLLNDKIYTRYWLGRYIPVLPSIIIDSHNLSFESLEKELCYSEQYVVQQSKSSGGLGTYVLNRENQMLAKLQNEFHELFIVSPYIYSGFAININAVIGQENTIIFPPSLQISRRKTERILYHGSDYVALQNMSSLILDKIYSYANTILERVKTIGYLGILGIDFLVTEDEVYFLEINPRYQASSFLINIALKETNSPSLSELNLMAFNEKKQEFFEAKQLKINYSYYKYLYTSGSKHLTHVFKTAIANDYISEIVYDGWNPQIPTEENAYCYSIIFQTNITSINPDFQYDLYPNIHGEEDYLRNNLTSDIGLKIALLNQGCVISPNAAVFLKTKGFVKKAVFSAIDFRLANGLPINSPVNLKFSELSPFSIRCDEQLGLYYYDTKISEITVEMQPNWSTKYTQNGVSYARIAYLSTDRLRLKHESLCTFKKAGKGCYFCNIPDKPVIFKQTDFEEVLDYLFDNPLFRHILIGGGSGDPQEESEQIINIVHMIRKRDSEIPIYLMSLPPQNITILKNYKEAGITEVAFNIEIWDRKIAKTLMPGKGSIPLEHYLDVLKEATKLWGDSGNVRTALIVGLNQTGTLLEATEYLCQNGIQPMFSVFRPMLGTKLESIVPPSDQSLLYTYQAVTEICAKYDLEPGPACKDCRNNMLAL